MKLLLNKGTFKRKATTRKTKFGRKPVRGTTVTRKKPVKPKRSPKSKTTKKEVPEERIQLEGVSKPRKGAKDRYALYHFVEKHINEENPLPRKPLADHELRSRSHPNFLLAVIGRHFEAKEELWKTEEVRDWIESLAQAVYETGIKRSLRMEGYSKEKIHEFYTEGFGTYGGKKDLDKSQSSHTGSPTRPMRGEMDAPRFMVKGGKIKQYKKHRPIKKTIAPLGVLYTATGSSAKDFTTAGY